jgi:hypothetical protein
VQNQKQPTTDILPPDPLGCEPGEIHPIWIYTYKCPFCERITNWIGFSGISVDEYAVGEDGTLYRKFEPADDPGFGCECGRGVWITSEDRCNIATIWSALREEQFGPSPSVGLSH